jgi:hypothetical protein
MFAMLSGRLEKIISSRVPMRGNVNPKAAPNMA